jgi:hypothetical protein
VRVVRAEEAEVITAWREHKAALAAEKKAQRSSVAARLKQIGVWQVVSCLLEGLLLAALLLPLPLAVLATELVFHYGTRLIPPDRLEQLW